MAMGYAYALLGHAQSILVMAMSNVCVLDIMCKPLNSYALLPMAMTMAMANVYALYVMQKQ